ncbi:general secretion pathway protein, partial [Salmonella enterica subsp. enterica serovar Enteritidis]|nr:general secretion pathway protein [Salmonella enterica subsp. enterica serovar Enteritidis]
LDQDNMIDVSLTQRLLKNMPAYQGKGADDSVVVSIRQPLTSMGN